MKKIGIVMVGVIAAVMAPIMFLSVNVSALSKKEAKQRCDSFSWNNDNKTVRDDYVDCYTKVGLSSSQKDQAKSECESVGGNWGGDSCEIPYVKKDADDTNKEDSGGDGSSGGGQSTREAINANEDQSTGNSCGGVNTSIINCSDDGSQGGGIFAILLIILNVLTFGVGIAGTLGIVIAGVMYLTARDNEAQVVKAKNMLLNVVIGLAAYALLWAFLQWIIPGGII